MDGFIFLVLALLVLKACLLYGLEGKGKSVPSLIAVTATLIAWCVGVLLDAYIDFGMDMTFRTLFPLLTMGACIIKVVVKSRKD